VAVNEPEVQHCPIIKHVSRRIFGRGNACPQWPCPGLACKTSNLQAQKGVSEEEEPEEEDRRWWSGMAW